MITLVATGVDSPQLAASLSSAQFCLIAIHLQEQEAQSPGKKLQTQLMIIPRGVRGPGNRPLKQHTASGRQQHLTRFQTSTARAHPWFPLPKSPFRATLWGLGATAYSWSSATAIPPVTLKSYLVLRAQEKTHFSVPGACNALHRQELVRQSFTPQKFFGRRISTVSQKMTPAINYI